MWYLVLSRSIAGLEAERKTHYEEHRIWLDTQHREGRMLFSGPTADLAYGIYVLLADSLDQARALAAQDSHHRRGLRTMEVFEWDPRRAFRLDAMSIADVTKLASDK